MPPVSVLLVDDHPIVRTGLRQILPRDRFRVVAEAGTGAEALARARETRPGIVVLDLRLPDQLAPEVVRDLRRAGVAAPVVVLTGFADRALLAACHDAGAAAVLVKDLHQGRIVTVLERVARGETVAAEELDDDAGEETLTPREQEVLRLVARGLTSAEIGRELHLATNTVRSYVQALLSKLGAHSRIEALAEARRRRLI